MGYNVADIINKAIDIAIRRRALYERIGHEKCDDLPIKVISKVLVKEINRNIQFYQELLQEANNKEFEEIDFYVYDKISFLLNDFSRRITMIEVNNVYEYLKFSLGLEKSVYSLLIDIQGRFVNSSNDIQTGTYKIISNMIKNKAEHIMMLEKAIEK